MSCGNHFAKVRFNEVISSFLYMEVFLMAEKTYTEQQNIKYKKKLNELLDIL